MVVQQSCLFALTAVFFKALIGFIVAHFVHNVPANKQRRWRGILLIPWVIPPAMSTLAWLWLFDPSYSAFNWILVHLGIAPVAWTGDSYWARFSVSLINVWYGAPFFLIMYLAALKSVPDQLYEAAQIDGAGTVSKFFSITLPQLRYTIVTSSVLILTGALTYFDLIWVMTQGGPGFATRILPLQMYIVAFQNQQVGYGSMLAVLLAVSGIVLSLVLLRASGFTKMTSQLEGL